MASLISMPAWVVVKLNSLVSSFFWSGKQDLVAPKVVYHSHLCGGFNVVSIRFKVYALLDQRVRRYVTAPNAWAHMMTFCFFDCFGVDPQTAFAVPTFFLLISWGLPRFYLPLFQAWSALHWSLSPVCLQFSTSC